jgi:general secretion pathway protein G
VSVKRRGSHDGFTLIEMLVVLAIIATLAGVVAPAIFRNAGDAKIQAARSQVETLGLALEAYRLDNDSYPSSDQGLGALWDKPTTGEPPRNWRGPYLRRQVPGDPWGRPYVYASPGKQNPTTYDLYSLGRDGKASGAGEDGDITSWGGGVRP